jgi:flagellar biosynthesis/type III secretory pathway chaperone
MNDQQPSLEETTVNGLPVSDLSDSGQRLFQRLIKLKQECDDLEQKFSIKRAALKELGDMIVEEVEEIRSRKHLAE